MLPRVYFILAVVVCVDLCVCVHVQALILTALPFVCLCAQAAACL